MDFLAGSSSSSTSKVFYSQPFSSQSKVAGSSQKGLENNSIVTANTFTTFPDNEVIVLSSSDSEEEPESNSTDNQLVFNKAKGKEREHVSSAVDMNILRQELFDTKQLGAKGKGKCKGKGKEREHSTESDFSTIVSSAGLNTAQVSDSYEEVDMEIDCDLPQSPTIVSNQSITWAIDTEIRSGIDQSSREQQLKEPSDVEKVIGFLNSYNYTFDIFDIVVDLSNKYQEIYQEDSVRLQLYYNNPCVLLELLSNLLSNRLNSDFRGTQFTNLEILAAEYYEKLRSAEIGRQGLYRISFRNDKFHKTAKSLNEEKRSVLNSRADYNPPATKDKKKTNKKGQQVTKKTKPSNEPRVDLDKILSSAAVQTPQKQTETKTPPLSITEHLKRNVFNHGSHWTVLNSINKNGDSSSSVSPQGNQQTSNSPGIILATNAESPSFHGTYNNQTMQTMASTSSNKGKHTVVIDSSSHPATTSISYEIDPDPNPNINIRRHVPREEWPTPIPSYETGKEYKAMMASALQQLAFADLAMKLNPKSGPGELGSVVNRFTGKKMKDSSLQVYNEGLINIFNHGGMRLVKEKLEEKYGSYLIYKPKENNIKENIRLKKKRRKE